MINDIRDMIEFAAQNCFPTPIEITVTKKDFAELEYSTGYEYFGKIIRIRCKEVETIKELQSQIDTLNDIIKTYNLKKDS